MVFWDLSFCYHNFNNKDPVVEEFYAELFKHWKLKKGVSVPCVSVDDDDDEVEDDDPNVDLSALFEVKDEPGEEDDMADEASDGGLTNQDPYMAVMDSTETQEPPGGQAAEATQGKDQQSESGDAVSVGSPNGEVAADSKEPSSMTSTPESVCPSTTCPPPSAIPVKKQTAALDEKIARLKLLNLNG